MERAQGGLIYFSSDSNRGGSASVKPTFARGSDPDIAQVQVQNKLALVPAETQWA